MKNDSNLVKPYTAACIRMIGSDSIGDMKMILVVSTSYCVCVVNATLQARSDTLLARCLREAFVAVP